uniref:Anaphase-promoting complex subunit 4 WD40 domain-containing protein n=1 Tax=Rhodosorus marinus TaxID=101924 RepID=A0A7S0BHV2_9RHOD|mmetsp:Transcript_15791/g.23108  ORF Transcript_15791/g.23108 Transcript_15791/m.23108 type:complete len:186 (+) Transcript_15791:196-753(+)
MNILLHPAPNWYSSSCFDIDYYGVSVAVATRNTVTFLETDNGAVIGELKIGRKERITSVRFNSALGLRHVLATGSSNGQIRVWDADSRREIKRFDPLKGHVIKSLEFPSTAPHVLLAGAASSRTRKGSLYSCSLVSDSPEPQELLEGVFEALSAPNEMFVCMCYRMQETHRFRPYSYHFVIHNRI